MTTLERIEKAEKELSELKALALKEKEEKKESLKTGDYCFYNDKAAMLSPHWYNTDIQRVISMSPVIDHGLYNVVTDKGGSCAQWWLRKATEEEIKTHLISEAEKKGFVKGAKIKNWQGNKARVTRLEYLRTASNGVDHMICVQDDLEQESCITSVELLPSTPSIGIGGKPVEFHENYVRIFDKPIPKERFSEIHEVFEPLLIHGINIQGVLVKKCNGDEVLITPKQIEAISNHFTK
jgi:hypothetical protein